MIFTRDFVFVHFQKTGGSFVTVMLKKLYEPSGREFENRHQKGMQHAPCRMIPTVHSKKQIIACNRNPYDRFVSLYKFGWWKIKTRQEAKLLQKTYPRKYPNISFDEFVRCMCGCGNSVVNRLSTKGYGLMTYHFVDFFFKQPNSYKLINDDFIKNKSWVSHMYDVMFLKQENLAQDLYDYLMSLSKFKKEDLEFILKNERYLPRDGRGGHGERKPNEKWQKFYTPELKKYVRNKERLLFEMFPEYDV